MLTNDFDKPSRGTLSLQFIDAAGTAVATSMVPYQAGALGTSTYNLALRAPMQPGAYTLRALVVSDENESTMSRRWVKVAKQSVPDVR